MAACLCGQRATRRVQVNIPGLPDRRPIVLDLCESCYQVAGWKDTNLALATTLLRRHPEREGSMPEEQRPASVREAGRRGGDVVKAKFGLDYYARIGRKGGLARIEKHGVDGLHAVSRKGGKSNADNHDSAYFAALGRRGAEVRRQKRLAAADKEPTA